MADMVVVEFHRLEGVDRRLDVSFPKNIVKEALSSAFDSKGGGSALSFLASHCHGALNSWDGEETYIYYGGIVYYFNNMVGRFLKDTTLYAQLCDKSSTVFRNLDLFRTKGTVRRVTITIPETVANTAMYDDFSDLKSNAFKRLKTESSDLHDWDVVKDIIYAYYNDRLYQFNVTSGSFNESHDSYRDLLKKFDPDNWGDEKGVVDFKKEELTKGITEGLEHKCAIDIHRMGYLTCLLNMQSIFESGLDYEVAVKGSEIMSDSEVTLLLLLRQTLCASVDALSKKGE